MAHSKLRQLPRISYFEPEDPSFDEYIYCTECQDYVYDMCPQHGPLLIVPDTKVPQVTNYPSYVPRAALTIPKAFLHIARSYIPGAGLGVFSSVTLPDGVRFGPYRGVIKKTADSRYCWQIYDRHNRPSHIVDGSDGHRSNWLRFINCSRNWNEQNLIAFQYKGQIYYRTIKIIPRNTELLVYYGGQAAHGLGIDLRFYNCLPTLPEPTPSTSGKVKELPVLPVDNKIGDDRKSKIANKDKKKPRKSEPNTENNYTETRSSTSEKVVESSIPSVEKNNRKKASNIPNNFTCDRCNKCFLTKTSLRKHILQENKIVHHSQSTNVQETITPVYEFLHCDICDFKTKQKRYIESHLKVHAANRVYSCRQCEYRCSQKSYFNRHIRTHTDEKPYSCHLCEYRCNRKDTLNKHIRTHTGEKPYSCHLCEYRGSRKGTLNEHIRTHTGEKPYSCHLCQYRCSQKGNLNKHTRTHR